MSGESAQTLLMNRYRIIRQLGQGGMGSVWLAEDTQLDNKLFAVKMLPSVLVSNRRAYNQLKAEALVSMRLTHPNIVTLRAFEENNGNPFLVMDYIDGVTLDEYLADREFQGREKNDGRASATVSRGQKPGVSEEEVVRILKPVAEALDYAHGEGVVHRDVKPANVMIRKDGHPFVLDFGIAREIQETMTRVTGKMSSGTLLYMSPEQLAGEAPKAPQDVYSFAAMAYECLKGEPPFCRGAIEDQIRNKIPAALPANIAIASSVMAGLEKSPDKRPSACSDVIGAAKTLPADAAPVRRVASVPARPVVFSPPVSKKPLDADVYLLEEDAKQLLQQKIDVISASVCPELDEGLAKAKRTYRAALNAMSRGDASAAKQLFGEFLNYPATRGKSATEIARAAFMAEEWSKGMSVAPEADQKDADILFWMGYCSEMGYGCEKDGGAAIRYYRGSAGFGNETAKFNLAVKLETGSDCEKNVSEAISLFEELASIGAVDAQKHLADIYRVGEIVEKDLSKSFKWYQAAGSTGDAYSCRMVGWFYENGHGVGKDAAKAKDWYRVAAKSGDAEAKRNLARLVEAEETARKEEEKRRAEAVRKAERERRAEAARKAEAAARMIRERREQKLRTIKEQWKKETEDYNAARARRMAAKKEPGTADSAPGLIEPVLLEPVSNGELSSVEGNSKSGRIGVLAVMLAILSAVLAAVWYWGWPDSAFVRGNGDVSACPPPKHESARPKNEISEKKQVPIKDVKPVLYAQTAADKLAGHHAQIKAVMGKLKDKMREITAFRSVRAFRARIDAIKEKWKGIFLIDLKPSNDSQAMALLKKLSDADREITIDLEWLVENKKKVDEVDAVERRIVKIIEQDGNRYDVRKYAFVKYNEGIGLQQEGKELLLKGEFAQSRQKLIAAESKLIEAVAESRSKLADLKSHLDAARVSKAKGDWKACFYEAVRALALDSGNPVALWLRKEAAKNATPELRIIAEIEGKEPVAGAIIKIEGEDYAVPVLLTNLTIDRDIGPHKVFCSQNGSEYEGEFPSMVVDWCGMKTIKVKLRECAGRVDADASKEGHARPEMNGNSNGYDSLEALLDDLSKERRP